MKLNKEEVRAGLANVKSTSQPSTGLRPPSPAPASEGHIRKLEWWELLTPGERKLICSLMRMLRGAKQSELRDVAIAAAKWERGIGCFIKVRLMSACRTGHRQGRMSISVKPFTSSPSISRIQPGASPNRG